VLTTPTVDLLGLGSGFAQFWTERHLCTLSTVRRDGTVHVTPVGVTLDLPTATARIICSRASHKARQILARPGAAVAVCQVDGRRWSTLEGRAVVRSEPDRVADAERRYEQRYRKPRVNPQRVVIEITVTKVLGNA
jgi:PPOX class probable F420-dependent enzyme